MVSPLSVCLSVSQACAPSMGDHPGVTFAFHLISEQKSGVEAHLNYSFLFLFSPVFYSLPKQKRWPWSCEKKPVSGMESVKHLCLFLESTRVLYDFISTYFSDSEWLDKCLLNKWRKEWRKKWMSVLRVAETVGRKRQVEKWWAGRAWIQNRGLRSPRAPTFEN